MGGGAGGDDNRKQSHCEIEKRRRDKMNHYITELASVIPAFNNNQSKLDKLTVLRMAVQQVKSLRSSLCSFSSFHLRPSFLSSGNLLKNLILQMASQESQDNLFMVVTCDRGKVLFVSESSRDILNQDQHEMVGQSLFDILHKDDVSKVKEQISYFNLMPKEMLVDSKTLQPIKSNQRESFFQLQNQANSTLQPGSRRSFFCRMKSGRVWAPQEKSATATTTTTAATTFVKSSTPTSAKHAPTSSKSQLDEPAAIVMTLQPKSNTSKTMISSKNQQSTKLNNNRHNKTSISPVKQIEKLNHQKDLSNKLSNSSERKYPHGGSSASTSSSFGSSSSRHNNSSDSGISSGQIVRKSSNKSQRTSGNIPATATTTKSPKEITMSREMESSEQPAGVCGSGVKTISRELAKTKQTCDDRGRRLHPRVISDEQAATSGGGGGGMDSQGSSISGDNASQGTSSQAQTSTSANESPSSSRSPSSSVSSPFSINKKDGKDGNVRCKPRRANGGKATSSGRGNPSAGNSIGTISSNRKQWRYIVMHCTGYLKSITVRNDEYDDDDDDDEDNDTDAGFDEKLRGGDASGNSDDENETNDVRYNDNQSRTINCLVAVCRRSVMNRYLKPDRPLTFTCRYSMEGKFTFVDQRTTVALGYMPQQLVGTSHYAYCHEDSVSTFKECHRRCILNSETVSSDIYQFRCANGQNLWLQTSLKSFRNPWTKLIDYIVANHTTAEGSDPNYNEGCVPTKFNQDMTGTGSQSSSPASSSSCPDSKKLASSSPSSIGSSYSMDSHASGANIQALLNQIDRVKTGCCQYPYKSSKRRGDAHHHHKVGSSGSSSARKSTDDSGNFSDLQSCSSISSRNSGSSSTGGYVNMQSAGDFSDNRDPSSQDKVSKDGSGKQQQPEPPPPPQQQQQQKQHQMLATLDPNSEPCLDDTYDFEQKQKVLDVFSSERVNCDRRRYEPRCQPVDCTPPQMAGNRQMCGHNSFEVNQVRGANPAQYANAITCKGPTGPRMATARLNRPPINSTSAMRPLQRPYMYSYRETQVKPNNMIGLDDQRPWASQNLGYSNNLAYNQSRVHMGKNEVEQRQTNVGNLRGDNRMIDKSQERAQQQPYGLQQQHQQQQQQLDPSMVMQTQQMTGLQQNQPADFELVYSNELVQPVNHFMTPGSMETHYTADGIVLGHQVGHQQVANEHLQSMTLSQQQQTSQQEQQQSTQRSNQQNNIDMSIPMIWNPAGSSSYQTMNTIPSRHHHQHHQMACLGNNSINVDNGGDNANMIGMNVIGNFNNQMGMVDGQQQVGECEQCANHKYCLAQNRQMIMNSNVDLSGSTELSSLAVDDLDEGELLECLAACDPSAQLYNIQNNTYSTQYNIYGEQ